MNTKELEQIAEKWAKSLRFGSVVTTQLIQQAIEFALTEALAPLKLENQTLRNAQKACVDCDAPTMERVKQLERERDELRDQLEKAHSGLVCFNLVANIQDTCRSRHFMKRPVDEAVIEMAQALDAAQSYITALESFAAKVREDALKEASDKLGQIVADQSFPYGTLRTMIMCVEAVQSLLIAPASNATEGGCEWKWSDKYALSETTCGVATLNSSKNMAGWKFCPYCGKPIKGSK